MPAQIKNISLERNGFDETQKPIRHFHIPGSACGKNSVLYCVFVGLSETDISINATVTDFTYYGQPSHNCMLGGVAFLDKKSKRI